MARKRLTREESRQETRARLLESAAELFAERGVNGASVEQIAEGAGYSRGAFYGNFADKHELVVELLKHRTLRELDEVTAIARKPEPFAALREWHKERAEHLVGWLSLRAELLLYALRNPSFRPQMAERERIARDAHAGSIEATFSSLGVEPPADPAFLALIVHALEDGLLVQRLLSPDEVSDGVVVDAVELLMRSWSAAGAAKGDS
ncbi:TetR family transcriptional regulator [Saccharopolyspora erythraea]|uniref:TetR/AcrR family transcriptional regulator n=1 Tax=Saccharopolyspora erythraea TaxID=1836 RepID=UPI001BA4D903|nr:TetR/AcrR family transcriptional regulator [Saccharopolyspora erythraea]QUH00167.1 TetR family transcriptional regulator [Saccharopolyspora erythraea]